MLLKRLKVHTNNKLEAGVILEQVKLMVNLQLLKEVTLFLLQCYEMYYRVFVSRYGTQNLAHEHRLGSS
jgi:hypothetical protein